MTPALSRTLWSSAWVAFGLFVLAQRAPVVAEPRPEEASRIAPLQAWMSTRVVSGSHEAGRALASVGALLVATVAVQAPGAVLVQLAASTSRPSIDLWVRARLRAHPPHGPPSGR